MQFSNSPFVEFSSLTLFSSVHVIKPGEEAVVGISVFCAVVVRSVVVNLSGSVVVTASSFVICDDEADVCVLVVDSVIGFLLDNVDAVVFGRFVVLRVTTVDLTVEVFTIGFFVVEGFMLVVEVGFSSESTEKVVTSISSAEIVVGSTFTM